MGKPLRVLFVEDNEDDMMLLAHELKKGGFDPEYLQVYTAETMQKSLMENNWDIIISDYSMPVFNGMAALKLFQKMNIDVPFIVVSGTIGEDIAVKMMRLGAHDYLLKGATKRLVPAVERELREAEERRSLKKTEAALIKSEELYRTIVETSSDSFFACDIHGKLLFASNQTVHLHGFRSLQELYKLRAFELFAPVDRPQIHTQFDTLPVKGKVRDVAVTMLHRNGSHFAGEFSATFMREAFGVTGVVLANIKDVSQRNRQQRALEESHQTLRRVLDGIDAAIYVTTLDTHEILFMNQYMKRLYGKDLIGGICHEVFRNRQTPCLECINDALVDENGNPNEVNVWEAYDPVTKRWLINYDRAIKWIDGKLVRLQVSTDISRIKELEQERLKTEVQLRQSQKMEAIGTLAGGIAHDFNNILAAIIGYTELAHDMIAPKDEVHEYLEEVLRAGSRARDLVQQILTFSRQAEQEVKPVQVNLLVKETLKLIRASLPATIEIRHSAQCDAMIMADPTQVHQILMNLCTNAGHAMQEKGGRLEVRLDNITLEAPEFDEAFTAIPDKIKPGHYLRLTVGDTGRGMEKEMVSRIFDPFFTTRGKGQGTGMGLAVVHGIVDALDGFITVKSEPSKGATFNVFLPALERRSQPEIRPEKMIPTGHENILLVDDEISVARMGKNLLTSLGYRVVSVTDSRRAIEIFREQPDHFDLVLTDMTMPGLTGDELARQIMQIDPLIPVVLCTGYSVCIDEKKAMAMGIRAFISKPVLKVELAETLRRVLDESKR